MSKWVYIGLAYGLAGAVLVAYLAYVLAALRRSRRHLETLLERPASSRDSIKEVA